MPDLQELLEAKRKDWATPDDLSEQPSERSAAKSPSSNPPVETAAPSTQRSAIATKQPSAKEPAPKPEPSEGDHISALLTELDTLPPHNSKLTKFIMRLEPQLADRLNQFCAGPKKLTPEMFVEAILLILDGDEEIEDVLNSEAHQDLKPLLTEQRDGLKALIAHVAQQRAERRSRAGVIRRTLSMARVDVPK